MPGYVFYMYDIATEKIKKYPLNLTQFYRPQRKPLAEFGVKRRKGFTRRF